MTKKLPTREEGVSAWRVFLYWLADSTLHEPKIFFKEREADDFIRSRKFAHLFKKTPITIKPWP